MYKDNETLITVEPIGKIESPNHLPVGTEVNFVKVVSNDLENSMLVVRIHDKAIVIKETDVKIRSWFRRKMAIRELNKKMAQNYPRLRQYQGFYLKKLFFKAYYIVMDKIRGEKVDQV